MERKIHSDVTGKDYDIRKVVTVRNVREAALFIKHGAELIDVYPTEDLYSGDAILCFIFDREATKGLFDLWQKHELK